MHMYTNQILKKCTKENKQCNSHMQSCPRQQASTCISVVGAQEWMTAMRQQRHGRGSALTRHGAVSSCRRRLCVIGGRRFRERPAGAERARRFVSEDPQRLGPSTPPTWLGGRRRMGLAGGSYDYSNSEQTNKWKRCNLCGIIAWLIGRYTCYIYRAENSLGIKETRNQIYSRL